MLSYGVSTTERSDPIVGELLRERSVEAHTALTPNELLGKLVVPGEIDEQHTTKLLVIAGGAASGKSTLAKAMQDTLTEQGIPTGLISSDDFVKGDRGDRRAWEQEDRSPDYKYNFDYMRTIIRAICDNRYENRYIHAPKYDAHSGKALESNRSRSIPRVGLLIIEGDVLGEQGVMPDALYPENTPDTDAQLLYLHLPDAHRLAYRVERDMKHRNGHGETPDSIVASFENRQRTQHLPYTLGYAAAANAIVQPVASPLEHGGRYYDLSHMR